MGTAISVALDQQRSIDMSMRFPVSTEGQALKDSRSLNLDMLVGSRDTKAILHDSRVISSTLRKQASTSTVAKTVQKVAGVIESVEGDSITCNLSIDGRDIKVCLPRGLFPQSSLKRGDCFYLEMGTSPDGFKCPIITERTPDLSKTKHFLDEIDSLIAGLEC